MEVVSYVESLAYSGASPLIFAVSLWCHSKDQNLIAHEYRINRTVLDRLRRARSVSTNRTFVNLFLFL